MGLGSCPLRWIWDLCLRHVKLWDTDGRQLLQGVLGRSVGLSVRPSVRPSVRIANGPCRNVSGSLSDTAAGHFYWKCNEQRRQLSSVTAIVQSSQHAAILHKILQVSHFRIYGHHREILQYRPMNGLIPTDRPQCHCGRSVGRYQTVCQCARWVGIRP